MIDVALEWVAPPQEGTDLTVTGNDPVLIPQGRRRADDRRFFPERADVKCDPPLSLQSLQPVIDDARACHRLVERDYLVDRQPRVEVSVLANDVHVPPYVTTESFRFFP